MAFRGPWDDPSDKRVLGAIGEATGEPTGFYDTSLLTVAWDDGTRTLTLTPVGDTFIVYVNGVKYLKRTETVTITDTEGLWFVYYDSDGVLTASQTFPVSLTDTAIVWLGYWDATNSKVITETGSNELHGSTMAGSTHLYLHETFGAQYESGLALGNLTTDGDGSSQDHITFSVASGEMHDEDVEVVISDGSPQDLTPIVQIPVYYLEGATPVWRRQDASNFAVILDGATQRPAYNNNNAGTWEQVATQSNNFVLVHVFMTNEKDSPIIAIQGQAEYSTKVAASAGADTEISVLYTVGLPLAEWIPIATLIVQVKDSYTNTQNARYVTDVDGADYIDWRTQQLQSVGATVTNIISAGDSNVQVVDSGTGEIDITLDGVFYLGIHPLTATNVGFRNEIINGSIQYQGYVTGPTLRNIAIFDPNNGCSFYHGNAVKIKTIANGINFGQAGNDGSLTALTGNYLELTNEETAGWIYLKGQKTGVGKITMAAFDPDGAALSYYAGVQEAETISGAFKATNALRIASSATNITSFLDEDDMSSNDANAVASQQSIKAYVDNNIGAPNVNYLINGNFNVWQRGTSFTSATTPANSDDTYLADRWVLLSDGNDIVDVTKQTGGGVDGNTPYIQLDVETISKKFGILQIIENINCQQLIGDTVSLSFECKVSDATKLDDVRAVVVAWSSTADTVTSDIVSTWNADSTRPTLETNWTAENTDSDLGVTSSWVRYEIANISIDTASTTNIAVFIYSCATTPNDTLGTTMGVTNIQLNKGANAIAFGHRAEPEEVALCQRYYEKSLNLNEVPGIDSPANVSFMTSSTGTNQGFSMAFAVRKRTDPTVTVYDTDGDIGYVSLVGGSDYSISTFNGNQWGVGPTMVFAVDPGNNGRIRFDFVAECEL